MDDSITENDFLDKSLPMKGEIQKNNYFSTLYSTLRPLKEIPENLWRIDKFDFQIFGAYISSYFIIWVLTSLNGDIYSPLAYWDGPNYVYAAKTLYNIPKDNPWYYAFRYPQYYFACHLPGFPLVIKFFSIIALNSYWIGDVLAIVFCTCLSIFVFRRLLIAYNCVNNPKWTTLLYLFLPIRMSLYRYVGASEPLFTACCYGALIFYKCNQKTLMLISLCYACLTRIEGLSIVGTIGLCYLLQFDILGCIVTSLTFCVHAGLLLFHKAKFGSYYAYFQFNSGLIQLSPFSQFFYNIKYIDRIPYLFPIYSTELLMFFGILIMAEKSLPFSIFSTVYLLYTSMLQHMDTYRYSLPGNILCLLIGFDGIWSHRSFKIFYYIPLVFYILSMLGYSIGQICTNRAPTYFLADVMDPSKP